MPSAPAESTAIDTYLERLAAGGNRKPRYMGFSAGTDPLEAARQFLARYGSQPREVLTDGGSVKAGPVEGGVR